MYAYVFRLLLIIKTVTLIFMLKLPPRFVDIRSSGFFELFIITAALTIFLTRLYLHITGYPAIDNGVIHIAHAVWGGILMMVGYAFLLKFFGFRMHQFASLIGGIGFGLFIDELGKFITHNNDYFFARAISLIYLIFVGMIIWSWNTHRRKLSEKEYLLYALSIMQDAVMEGGVDEAKRDQALKYLRRCNQSESMVVQAMKTLAVLKITTVKPPDYWEKLKNSFDNILSRFVTARYTEFLIDMLFIIKAIATPIIIVTVLLGEPLFDTDLAILQLIATGVACGFVAAGVVKLRFSKVKAYELFIKSLLIDIFITQTFLFYRVEFSGLILLAFNIFLYIVLDAFLYRKYQDIH